MFKEGQQPYLLDVKSSVSLGRMKKGWKSAFADDRDIQLTGPLVHK
jgi:hypothetical protein